MNPELIRYARKHRYEIAEGFCMEGKEGDEWEAMMKASFDKLPPPARELFEIEVENLSRAAGVTISEAWSAILNYAVGKYVTEYESAGNN